MACSCQKFTEIIDVFTVVPCTGMDEDVSGVWEYLDFRICTNKMWFIQRLK